MKDKDKNQVWLVTGASKGLGLFLVKNLLSCGHSVAATSRDVMTLKKAVGISGREFLPLEVDLGNEESISTAVESTLLHFGRIDTLVNNAGFGQTGAIEEVSDGEARLNFDVNVFFLLNALRATLPVMRKQKSGHIFNISSIGGLVGGFSGWGIYCATKFAVAGISEGLHADLKELGIQVTLVYPGYFRTNFLEKGSMKRPENIIDGYFAAHRSIEAHAQGINGKQAGDPDKFARSLINLSNIPDAPLHLFLGSDAYDSAKRKIKEVDSDLERMKQITCSTEFTNNRDRE